MYKTKSGLNKKIAVLIAILIILIAVGLFIFIGRDSIFKDKYPLDYVDYIAEQSTKYGLDPYFTAAVINTESGFKKDAVSSAGAMGLMQIMPETGDWISEKLTIEDYESEMLFDPYINIEFGCWYLNFLSERFNGDKEIVSAAYNAGHNRVQNWMADENIFSDGKLINIPFEETETYVKKVMKAYDGYKKEYPDVFITKSN